MSCPTPEELLRGSHELLEGDAHARQTEHVAACDRCRRLVATWQAIATATPATLAGSLARGPQCIDERVLIDYLAGRVDGHERGRLVRHIADCRHCLGQLAEAVVGFGQPLPAVAPADADAVRAARRLAGRPLATAPSRAPDPTRLSWLTASVAAAALVVLVAGGLFRAPTPGGPDETLRRSTTATPSVPELTAPYEGQRLRRDELTLRWHGVSGARRYAVSLLDERGELLWDSVVATSEVRVPEAITLAPGARYFVWVSAELESGRRIRSRSVAFELVASRPPP